MDRKSFAFLSLVAAMMLAAPMLRADHAPYYLPDGTIVHGDWGLYRPGHVAPWIEGPYVVGGRRHGSGVYFPSNRNDPWAYRRRPPVDAAPIPPEPYYRSWGTHSPIYAPSDVTTYPPFEPPAVIYAPESGHYGKGGAKKK